MIVHARNMNAIRPRDADERRDDYRDRLATALQHGRVDPADIQFREIRGHFVLDALRAYWRGRPQPDRSAV